jgi:hypothetical protein
MTVSGQSKSFETKAYKGRQFTGSGNRGRKAQSPKKRDISTEQPLKKEIAERATNAAKEEWMFYFSCRSDYWWRAIHTCEDNKVLCALATAHLAFALSSSELEVRECLSLPTKLDPQRNVELYSCFSISSNGIELKAPEDNQNPQELRILNDINARGVVVFAEMQQQRETIKEKDESQTDKLPLRTDGYANFVATRDHGKLSKNARIGKK